MNDKMIESFLKDHTLEVADNGFTDRVMRALPEEEWQRSAALRFQKRLSQLWTAACIVAAVGFFAYTGLWSAILIDIKASINSFYPDEETLKTLMVIAMVPGIIASITARKAYIKLTAENL